MMPPYVAPYAAIYAHGGVYAHPGVTVVSPLSISVGLHYASEQICLVL